MRRRRAFTIIELLVSMALIMFIMVILTEAFSAGMETFRQLKALGDLNERLRTASTILRRDLAADHFESGRRLSDPTWWSDGYPAQGFFSVQGSLSTQEGTDLSLTLAGGNPTPFVSPVRATDHVLAMTVKLRGNSRESFFSASVPFGSALMTANTTWLPAFAPDAQFMDTANVYNSQWAEVTYFLVSNGTSAGPNTPLYTLYRSQLVVVPNNSNLSNPFTGSVQDPNPNNRPPQDYRDLSCNQTQLNPTPVLYFNTPSDLTNPDQRAYNNRIATGQNLLGASFLLSDVISFDVRVLRYDPANPDAYFVDVRNCNPTLGFDTADPNVGPPTNPAYSYVGPQKNPTHTPYLANNYVIKAIQINLRIWDLKTQQTRQVTITQDM